MRKDRDEPADVAETLDRDAGAFQGRAAILQELFRHENDAASGRSFAALAAMKVERFAGHNGRRKSVDLRVLIHHPRHHLGIGVHVRGRDISLRTDFFAETLNELPGHSLHLA